MWQRCARQLRPRARRVLRACQPELCTPLGTWTPLGARGVADRINGVSATVQFERFFEAPTMDADQVVRTLQHLVQEQSSDVHLLGALTGRFHAHAEEFFPPQIEDLLGGFASLGYTDDRLLRGLQGRIQDLASDASPRRVVRLLRYGSTLQLQPEAWLVHVLPSLERHMPNLREGLPSVLAYLHALRWLDTELTELLLTQGFIVSEDLGDAFLARLLEAWSRFGQWDQEVQDRLEELAKQISGSSGELGQDLRDGINVLAGLLRCGAASKDKRPSAAALELEEQLAARLRGAGAKEAADALVWMRRLSLRSAPLWKACGDAVELALKEPKFVRDSLPDAVHSLACVASLGESEEAALVASLLAAPEVKAAIPRFSAGKSLQLLHAACMLRLPGDSTAPLASQVARLARQLSLPERRTMRTISDSLAEGPLKAAARSLPVAALPPLLGNEPAGSARKFAAVTVGAESLLTTGKGGKRSGLRFLGFGDTLAGTTGHHQAGQEPGPSLSPSCELTMSALAKQGWDIELRA